MAIPFSPRAALCTFIVMAGFAVAVTANLPGGLSGLAGMDRDGLLPVGGGAAPESDQRDIVMAVLAYEARRPGRADACLRLADEGSALAGERQAIGRLQRMLDAADEDERARLIELLDRSSNPARPWRTAPSPGGPPSEPLGPENARQLSAAETMLLGAPGPARVDIALDMAAVPEVLKTGAPDCADFAFTAPAIAGDVAFVETRHQPRGAPADAWIHAVVRSDGVWRVEAMARTEGI